MGKKYNQTCCGKNKNGLEIVHASAGKKMVEADYNKKNSKNQWESNMWYYPGKFWPDRQKADKQTNFKAESK